MHGDGRIGWWGRGGREGLRSLMATRWFYRRTVIADIRATVIRCTTLLVPTIYRSLSGYISRFVLSAVLLTDA